jgi:hypothetical protein
LKCEQITTAYKVDIDEQPIGPSISPARLREVERAVARAIGVPA